MSRKQIGNYDYLLIPMILIMLIVIGWPLVQTVLYSFTDAQLLEIQPAQSVGLQNFAKAFQNKGFLNSLRVSGICLIRCYIGSDFGNLCCAPAE